MSNQLSASFTLAGKPLRAWEPLLLVLAIGIAWTWMFYFQEAVPPFEDAAMLLRYAEHVADGHGIVWNIGEKPVDGATDFLFMMLVAGLSKLGLGVEMAAPLLTLGAQGLTVVLVYAILVRKGNPWVASVCALVIATGPGLSYCEALFGTTVFALSGLIAFSYFLRMIDGESKAGIASGFAIAGLVTGLIRPEGVVLVFGMLASLIWFLRGETRKRMLMRFLAFFIIPGILYFGWHWWYFGFPLPNPFYVKGGGSLYPASLKASFVGIVKMGTFLLPLFSLAVYMKDSRRKSMLLLIPIVLFGAAWILMSNAMNYSNRFQYILMPIMWVVWLPMVQAMKIQKKWLLLSAPLVAFMIAFQFFIYAHKSRIHQDGRADLGIALTAWKDNGYTMAVTEAGNLPLYSQWRSIDTWGLNDSHIAHAGGIDQAYLDQQIPALVMIHDYWSPGVEKLRPEAKWAAMTDTLESYLKKHDFALVACWGREANSTHFYYLRKDLPDFVAIRDLIAAFPYRWYEDGELAENFLRGEE